MPRELRSSVLSLIATGNYGMHTTHDITLTDGTELFLSSGDINVNADGKIQQYDAYLDEVQELQMSSDNSADMQEIRVTNANKLVGQALTGAVRQFDGARSVIGTILFDRTLPFISGNMHWDSRMPCELSSGEVSDEKVAFTATSDPDAVQISGRLISKEFVWRESIHAPSTNPNDLGSGGILGSGLGGDLGGDGRFGDLDFPVSLLRKLAM